MFSNFHKAFFFKILTVWGYTLNIINKDGSDSLIYEDKSGQHRKKLWDGAKQGVSCLMITSRESPESHGTSLHPTTCPLPEGARLAALLSAKEKGRTRIIQFSSWYL